MNIQQLIDRSKELELTVVSDISSKEENEELVPLLGTGRIMVDPIWKTQIDDIEGPLYSKYIEQNPKYKNIYIRKEVRKRLVLAANSLPASLKLVVRAGHRPVIVQQLLLQSLIDKYHSLNPDVNDDEALDFARTYVSDPAISLPPHCCGAAVDVDILDMNSNELLDFGCSVNTDSEIAFLHSELVTKEQRKNRLILLTAMLNAGFASHPNEWWHYSYGDNIWAKFYNKKQSIYGIIEPELY